MSRFIPNENTWVGFTTARPADLASPTASEVAACTVLTGFIVSLNPQAQGNTVPTPNLDSLYETVPGTVQASFTGDFYRDDTTDTAWESLPRGDRRLLHRLPLRRHRPEPAARGRQHRRGVADQGDQPYRLGARVEHGPDVHPHGLRARGARRGRDRRRLRWRSLAPPGTPFAAQTGATTATVELDVRSSSAPASPARTTRSTATPPVVRSRPCARRRSRAPRPWSPASPRPRRTTSRSSRRTRPATRRSRACRTRSPRHSINA